MLNFIKRGLLLAVLAAPLAPLAQAQIINTANVSGLTTFGDTQSGLVWFDIDNFWGAGGTYNSYNSQLQTLGYHIATTAELQQLQADWLPSTVASFSSDVVTAGGNYVGISPSPGITRNIIWGVYNDGNAADGISWSWISSGDTHWNTSLNVANASNALNSYNPDLGVWAISNATLSPVPEASTYGLIGAATLLGLGLLRKRKQVGGEAV